MSKSPVGPLPAVAASDQNLSAIQPDTLSPSIPLSRRSMLTVLGASCAGLLAPHVLAASSQSYVRKAAGKSSKGQILSAAQLKTLSAMVEVIIPTSDTAGAAATDTHGFIDDQLAHCHVPAEAQKFIADLDSVSNITIAHWGKGYEQLSLGKQNEVMKAMAEGAAPFSEPHGEFFDRLKSLTLFGYYSSEVGMTKELVYLPVPGGYDGKFKLSDNGGKAFSLFTF